ncbi:MAG: tetratricopeptide repeat protein [Pirellulaceae bacterium]|nr:tetratricopeptide repeat protein [Pirellulaceae bacterium]
MSQATIELRDIVLSNSSFGPNDIQVIARKISDDYQQFPILRDLTAELESQTSRSPASSVRLGVCQYLLGRYRAAIATLETADGGALAHFYQGRSHFALGNYTRAIECYESSKQAGLDASVCQVAIAEAKRLMGDVEGAMAILDNLFGPIEQTAEYLSQRAATIALLKTNPDEVVRLYERAVEIDGRHAGALFGLGLENDRRGNDDRAMELYQRASSVFPAHVGALLNLGLLYEDHGQFGRATRCYDRILDAFPGHERARLFRRDAAESMHGGERWDEDRDRVQRRLQTIMQVPIAQFELSVRSRNCLQKMGIITLGDLTRVTEADLLASKNFGETSLVEIREMMKNKNLSIGQFAAEPAPQAEVFDSSSLSPDEQALFDRPISELNLSVRARKCMTRLGLTTIGELVRKSGDDMLECKNFGVTSLNEVREKLEVFGLKMRGE